MPSPTNVHVMMLLMRVGSAMILGRRGLSWFSLKDTVVPMPPFYTRYVSVNGRGRTDEQANLEVLLSILETLNKDAHVGEGIHANKGSSITI
jgi:hypothetical protein